MRASYIITINGKDLSLSDCIESFALCICEDVVQNNEKKTEDILRDCKILDSLSRALLAIKT